MTAHGGDVWRVAEEQGVPVSDLLDFSASINPRGLPRRALERLARDASDARLLSLYPDPSARRLRTALSERHGVPPETILIGPGAEALLAPILRSLGLRRVLVPVPAFSEYRRVCEAQELEFTPFPLDRRELFRVPVADLCRRVAARRSLAVLLSNPHNPSGALLEPDDARHIVTAAREMGSSVVLDEAFINYAPHATLAAEAAAEPGLVVIRSLTKFYGCAGLRIGYAIASADTVRRAASLLPAWPVTQLAIDALAEAVQDCEYAQESLRDNAGERERQAASLRRIGLFVFPSAANYLLLELPRHIAAPELCARLLSRHRILIRNCDSYGELAPGRFVRVAVRGAVENRRLLQALAAELTSK